MEETILNEDVNDMKEVVKFLNGFYEMLWDFWWNSEVCQEIILGLEKNVIKNLKISWKNPLKSAPKIYQILKFYASH